MIKILRKIFYRYPWASHIARQLKWRMKRIPGLRRILIAMDTAYFRSAGKERPHHESYVKGDPYTQSYVKELIPQAKGLVLDIGCGKGYLTNEISRNSDVKEVLGVDKISEFLEPEEKVTFITRDLTENLVLPNNFDVIVSSEFIEHIEESDFRRLLPKIVEALKLDGVFIGSTPHNPTPFKTFSGSRFHVREYSISDLKELLEEFFADVEIFSTKEHCLIWRARGLILKTSTARMGFPGNRALRVLFTVEYFDPHIGGAEEVVKRLAQGFVNRGHQVTIATSSNLKRRINFENKFSVESFEISGNSVRGIRGSAKEIERYQEFLMRPFDIVLNYAAQSWTTDLAFLALDKISAKKVLVPCGYSALADPAYHEYFVNLPQYLEKYDKLVYMSENYQDKSFGAKEGFDSKSVIIPNGASKAEFLTSSEVDIKTRLNIRTPYLAICVSNHLLSKGHSFVIKAFRKMRRRDTTLLIIGEQYQTGGYRKIIQTVLDYVPCKIKSITFRNIRVVGGKDRRLVVGAYSQADLFLFGSKVECAPLVMYESFASKTPFISTNVGNVGDYSSVACIAQTSTEMAQVANQVLDDHSKSQSMTESGYELWQSKHQWEQIISQYEKLFIEITRKNE